MQIIQIGNSSVSVIGDPHLGKKFTSGVPFNRRGEREADQLEQFSNEVCSTICPTIIVMGDLFDRFIVDYETLYRTYLTLCKANQTGVSVYILQGNHDVSRNTEQKSSLDILNAMVSHLSNIKIIREVEYIFTTDGTDKLMLVPYYEFETASDVISSEVDTWITPPIAAFGHWEIESFGGNDNNLMPIKLLAKHCEVVVTGHIHTASAYYVSKDGDRFEDDYVFSNSHIPWCRVIVTGSMQPYSFAEDPDSETYITVSLEEYNKSISVYGAEVFHDMCVRLLLKEGEEPPVDVDALQFIYKSVNDDMEEVVEAKMEVFSFKDLFVESMKANSVSEEDTEEYWKKYQEVSSDAANA